MEYQCSVCGRTVAGDLAVYVDHTEEHIIDVIKQGHPDWVESNGLCKQCLAYYRGEIKGGFWEPARCKGRRKRIKKILGSIFNVFQVKKQ